MEYDPLLAKLIGYGESREQAIARLRRAVKEYFVGGIKTNLPLFRRILADAEFERGKTDTGYLDRLPRNAELSSGNDEEVAAIAGAIFASLETPENGRATIASSDSVWRKAARTEALS